MSCVIYHMSRVTCYMSHVHFFFFYKVVKLIGGGSVINEAYPIQFLFNDSVSQSVSQSSFSQKSSKQLHSPTVRAREPPYLSRVTCHMSCVSYQLKKTKKIPHTRDKASLDRCGQQHRCHRRVEQEYPKTRFF